MVIAEMNDEKLTTVFSRPKLFTGQLEEEAENINEITITN
jgi:hypothetical protein